jgi:RNA polymerase sigma-70 factor (ECF subfamily)
MQPDERLVTLALRGSAEAADDLVRRHWPACRRIAYGIVVSADDADEVAQEAFARAFASLETCRDRARFPQWLHRIAANSALDRVRSRRPVVEYDDDVEPASAPVATELGDVVVEALAALAPERRAVLVLRYWFGYTHEEIAQLLDIPAGTVGSRVGRGLDDLRRILEVADVDRR